jgi:hypothetical protein
MIIGSYLLIGDDVHYVGRSDVDLRQRLISHARQRKGEFFAYDVHPSSDAAYAAECACYHALAGQIRKVIHPASPAGRPIPCPFCRTSALAALGGA